MTALLPPLVAQADLIRRWTYSRQGVVNLINNDPRFPVPAGSVNGGRTQLWLLSDIEAYEGTRPWLNNTDKKAEHRLYLARRRKLKSE
jgi:hypothetical protein